jgi:hypothetical protein
MKTFVTLFSAILLLTSCSKKSCYTCTTTIVYTPSSAATPPGYATANYCDKTAKEIQDIEKVGSYTSTATSMGYTVTTIASTKCVMK